MSKTPPAIDPQQQAEQRRDIKRQAREDREDLAWVMSSPRGRRVIAALIETSCEGLVIGEDDWIADANNATDTSGMLVSAGMRRAGVQLKRQLLDLCPHEFVQMVTEWIDKRAREQAFRKDAEASRDGEE